MSELVAWCFYSPRRFLVIVAVVIAVIIGGGVAVRSALPHAGTGTATAPSVGTVSVAGSGAAVDAAETFTRALASKPASTSPAQWLAALQPLVTPDLGRLLGETNPTSLPGGAPVGRPSIRFLAVSSALIEVPLSTGQPVLVTVVQLDGHWLASDVQPLAGDSGDVSPGPAVGTTAG